MVRCAPSVISSIRIQKHLSLHLQGSRSIYAKHLGLISRKAVRLNTLSERRTRESVGALERTSWWSRNNSRKLFKTQINVVADLRADSPRYGKYHGEFLTEENRKQFLIPKGFAHGYLVLSDTAEFFYKCDDFYHPDDEGGMAWNDPEIGIAWPGLEREYRGTASSEGYTVSGAPLKLSDNDQRWLGIRDTFKF